MAPKRLPRNYDRVSTRFAYCLHSDCPLADRCLRQTLYRSLDTLGEIVKILNPLFPTKQQDCPYYRSSEKVKFAKGFTNFQRHMSPAQYDKFRDILTMRYGRSHFYERRKGTTLLPPRDQKYVRSVLRTVGVTIPLEFDRYEEHYDW